METGIVLEIKGNRATIMKTNGEFASVRAKNGWQKGDVVSLNPVVERVRALYVAAACFALIVSLGAGLMCSAYFTQTSLVSMDVNPSIELELNRWDRVIHADAYNSEGGQILASVNVKNKKYTDALRSIIESEEMSGYIADNANVIFTVHSTDGAKKYTILDILQSVIGDELASHHQNANVESYAVDSGFVAEAHGHHVTAGKYKALMELQEVAPDANIGDYAHHSITEIKGQIQNHKNGGNQHGPSIQSGNHGEGNNHNGNSGNAASQVVSPAVQQPTSSSNHNDAGNGHNNVNSNHNSGYKNGHN